MPDGGRRTPLALSYSWGQTALETQFASTFQPGHGIFSPGTPLVPTEPERTRVFDFPIGVNTILMPRAYEPVSFTELRALAEAHDITRLAIETRKDQIEKLDWAIKSRDARRPAGDAKSRAEFAELFHRRKSLARHFRKHCLRRHQQVGVRPLIRTTHPPAQLVQLGKSKPVSAIDQNRVCPWNVQAILYNCCGN